MAKTARTLQGSDEEILDQLSKIRTRDKDAEKIKSHGTYGMVASVLVGGGFLFLGAQSGMPDSVLLFFLALCAAGFVVSCIAVSKGSAGDIDDERYETLERLHRFLSQDCDKDAQYFYTVDFRPYTDATFRSDKTQSGGMFSYPIVVMETFETPVLSGQYKLRDGTSLSISIDRTTLQRTRTKKNIRGKTKTKIKTKYKNSYLVKAKLPEALQNGNNAGAEEMPNSTPTPTHLQERPDFVPGFGKLPDSGPSAPRRAASPTQKDDYRFKIEGPKVTALAVEKTVVPNLNAEPMLSLLTWTFRKIHLERRQQAS